ncbi:MAG: hypothetical protein A49_17930 [Methyloceanibacter sp.]|nr:MAG: hypothetical protein A49_17930 [Methyloceanibacter sp.]
MPSPQQSISLHPHEEEILIALTFRVPFLSEAQAAFTWWGSGSVARAKARRRFRALEQAGLIEQFVEFVRRDTPPREPLVVWRPGDPQPDLIALSSTLRGLSERGLVQRRLLLGTAMAAELVGGRPGRRPRRSEVSHDLRIADVFLIFRREFPGRARYWFHESAVPLRNRRFGEVVPDVMIVTKRRTTVIEVAGEYSARHLAALHDHCRASGYAYELW